MNQKAEQKQRSHDAILSSAAELLRRQGIKASSVTDVMKGAGLTVGGFYGHFDSKEQLFATTLRTATGTLWRRLLQEAEGDSAQARARNVLRRYLSRSHRDDPTLGCMLPAVAPEIAREGGPYRTALEQELSAFVTSFAELLSAEGVAESMVDGQTPEARRAAREKALGLFAMMYGALSLSRAVAGTPLSDELLLAARRLGEGVLAEAPGGDQGSKLRVD